MSRRGMTWSLDVEVVDKGSKKELADLARSHEQAAKSAIESARDLERASTSEAQTLRATAQDKRAAADAAAAAASRAAEAEVKAAREAQRANSDAARKRLADAREVRRSSDVVARSADREASAAEKSARDRERASDRATKAVKRAQQEHQQATDKVRKAEQDLADDSEQQAKRLANAWGGVKGRIGSALDGLGGKGKAGLAAAGVAGGAAFMAGMSAYMGRAGTAKRLAAQLGVPEREAEQIGQSVGRLYAKGFGETRDDVAAVAVDVTRNLGDLTRREMERATGTTIQIADLFDTDSAELTRSVGSMLKNGLAGSVDEALDAVTVGFQRGANVGDELLDTLNEYAEPMKSLGIDASTFTGMLVKGAEQGVWSIDKLGDAYKEFSIRAVDGSTASVDAYHALGLSAREYEQEIAKGGPAAQKATSKIIAALRGVSDPVKREAAGVALFGTMWEDVGGDILLALDPAKAEIEGTAGAARDLGEAFDTPGQRLEAFKRQVTDSVVNFIGTEAVPVLEDLGEAAQEHWPEIRDEIEPVAVAVKDVTKAVAKFVAEHPGLLKVAAGAAAVAGAVKTIKFVGAITGVNSLLRGLGKLLPASRRSGAALGAELGTELGSTATSNARGQMRRNGALTGGLSGRMKSVGSTLGSWLGLSMGKNAADKAGDGLAKDGAITGKASGRMGSIGRSLGGVLGKALGVAAVGAVAVEFNAWMHERDAGVQDIWRKFKEGMSLDFLTKMPFGGASGGRITTGGFRRFAAGGLATAAMAFGGIPAMLSPGEMVEYAGAAGIVPGARVAADTVPMILPDGARVFTDHGQDLLAMGATPEQALRDQIPHFNTGGTAKKGKKKPEKKKPVRSARVGATVYDDAPPGAFGALTNGYAELGTATRRGIATKRGHLARALGLSGELAAHQPLTITINGRTHTLRKADRGYGQGGDGTTSDPGFALDVWKDSWGKFGINGNWKGQATVALGTAAQVKANGTTGRSYSYTEARSVGRSATRGGLLEDPYSAASSAVEAFGSRAAARRAGALTAPIREELDNLKDSYTRKVERSAPPSRSGATGSTNSGRASSGRRGATAGGWTRPVGGPITSGFGVRNGRMHKGIDFGVGVGTAVRAVRAGTVALGMNDPGGWGMNTRVEHENGLSSLYAHLSKVSARPGTRVSAGDLIARSGNSGRSTGPHLHLETWRNGTAFNPAEVIKLRRGGRAFAKGGKVTQTRAVTAALGDVRKSTSDDHLRALSEAVSTATLQQIEALRRSLLAGIRKGGDAAAVARLRGALSVLQMDIAGRVQESLGRTAKLVSGWEAKTDSASHWMRRSGVDEGSSQGQTLKRVTTETYLRSQSNSELASANEAIKAARKMLAGATNPEARATAKGKLDEARDAKSEVLKARTEARTVLEEMKQQMPRILAGERVAGLDLRDAKLAAAGANASLDVDGMRGRQAEYTAQLAEAVRQGNQEWQTDAYSQLATINASLRDLPNQLAAKEDQTFDLRSALAALTEGDEDDLQVTRERQARTQERLDQALADLAAATNEADRDAAEKRATEAARSLKGIHDELKTSNAAQQERDDRDEDIRDLLSQIAESTARSARGAEKQAAVSEQWRTDQATGQVARNVGMGAATPGYAGGGVRG